MRGLIDEQILRHQRLKILKKPNLDPDIKAYLSTDLVDVSQTLDQIEFLVLDFE